MKVITLIQSMQAAIDALSIHSADTEVRLTPRGYGELTGAIDVGDPDVDGKVIVSLDVNPIKFDVGLFGGKEDTKKTFDQISRGDLWDQLTIAHSKNIKLGKTDREEYDLFIDGLATPKSWPTPKSDQHTEWCRADHED